MEEAAKSKNKLFVKRFEDDDGGDDSFLPPWDLSELASKEVPSETTCWLRTQSLCSSGEDIAWRDMLVDLWLLHVSSAANCCGCRVDNGSSMAHLPQYFVGFK